MTQLSRFSDGRSQNGRHFASERSKTELRKPIKKRFGIGMLVGSRSSVFEPPLYSVNGPSVTGNIQLMDFY